MRTLGSPTIRTESGLKPLVFVFCLSPAAHGAEADPVWISQSPPAEGDAFRYVDSMRGKP